MGRQGIPLVSACLGMVALLLATAIGLELARPRVLLVGNVTVDLVNGVASPGGAVVYAAAVAAAWGLKTCVVTAAGADAALDAFRGHDLHIVPSNATLTFEHSYTLWGAHRKLRVTAQPNVTLTMDHVPRRCRSASLVLLGPLMPEDLDPASFVNYSLPLWQRLLGYRQPLIGLMGQGLQRGLDASGRVVPLTEPSPLLEAALGPRTTVFLSDVETDTWRNGTLEGLAAHTRAFVVTRGSAGADEHAGGRVRRHSQFPVDEVVDTNGAGDCFATAYALADLAGRGVPGAVGNWGGAMAVTQPQSCKPRCVVNALQQHWESMPGGRREPWGLSGLVAQLVAGLPSRFTTQQ